MTESRSTKNIGYTTMTADLFHVAHLNFLKTAKSLCDVLIVGVTVDARCKERKRNPVIPFEQRKAIVEAIKYVDIVVEDTGQSKQKMCEDLNISSIFIGDDYCGHEEYISLRETHPEVKVFFFPRTSHVSTSAIIANIKDDVLSSLKVLNYGISGPILYFPLDKKHEMVLKPILLGASESKAESGRDVYHIATPLPRNWKVGKIVTNKFPMISGVNGWREIIVMKQLQHLPFIPYVNTTCVREIEPIFADAKMDKIEKMQYERKYATKTMMIHMFNAGKTLAEYVQGFLEHHTYDETAKECQHIFSLVKSQIEVLREHNVVHGDLHPNNVCVSINDENDEKLVSFVDFGWSMSKECEMSQEEQIYFQNCLAENFDWQHFYDSLESFDLLKFVSAC